VSSLPTAREANLLVVRGRRPTPYYKGNPADIAGIQSIMCFSFIYHYENITTRDFKYKYIFQNSSQHPKLDETVLSIKWVSVTMAWRVLRLRMEEMASRYGE
jgi:hypothetical protein